MIDTKNRSRLVSIAKPADTEKYSYVDEEIFSADETVKILSIDGTDYTVTILTREAEHE